MNDTPGEQPFKLIICMNFEKNGERNRPTSRYSLGVNGAVSPLFACGKFDGSLGNFYLAGGSI